MMNGRRYHRWIKPLLVSYLQSQQLTSNSSICQLPDQRPESTTGQIQNSPESIHIHTERKYDNKHCDSRSCFKSGNAVTIQNQNNTNKSLSRTILITTQTYTHYTVSHKKTRHFYFCDNSGKYWPISIILSLSHSQMNYRKRLNKIYHLTSNLLPHYHAKFECST